MISTEQLMDILEDDFKQNKGFVIETLKEAKKQNKKKEKKQGK